MMDSRAQRIRAAPSGRLFFPIVNDFLLVESS